MRDFEELTSLPAIDTFLEEHPLAFLFISRTNCGICHALLPQVKEVMQDYPEIRLGSINADHVEAVAGRFSVLTIPVLLLFIENKEYVREARIVHMDLFKKKIDKLYKNVVET